MTAPGSAARGLPNPVPSKHSSPDSRLQRATNGCQPRGRWSQHRGVWPQPLSGRFPDMDTRVPERESRTVRWALGRESHARSNRGPREPGGHDHARATVHVAGDHRQMPAAMRALLRRFRPDRHARTHEHHRLAAGDRASRQPRRRDGPIHRRRTDAAPRSARTDPARPIALDQSRGVLQPAARQRPAMAGVPPPRRLARRAPGTPRIPPSTPRSSAAHPPHTDAHSQTSRSPPRTESRSEPA